MKLIFATAMLFPIYDIYMLFFSHGMEYILMYSDSQTHINTYRLIFSESCIFNGW